MNKIKLFNQKKIIRNILLVIMILSLFAGCAKKAEPEIITTTTVAITTTTTSVATTTTTTTIKPLMSEKQKQVLDREIEKQKKKKYRTGVGNKSADDEYRNPNPEGDGGDINMANLSNDDNIEYQRLNPADLAVKDILSYKIEKIDSSEGKTRIAAILHTPCGWYPLNVYISETDAILRGEYPSNEATKDKLKGYTFVFIKALAELLNQIPVEKRDVCKISVLGHADPSYMSMKPDYSEESRIFNQSLSEKRANNTVKILTEQFNGILYSQVENLGGFGWSKLVKNSDGTTNYEQSRRIEINIIY